VCVSSGRVDAFTRSFLAFSHGKTVSDDAGAPGIEIGRPTETYRRVRIESTFCKLTVLVTDGHLPCPYGGEITGYEIANLADTPAQGTAAGVAVLVETYIADHRSAAIMRVPLYPLHHGLDAIARGCSAHLVWNWSQLEPKARTGAVVSIRKHGGQGRNRTADASLFRAALYQLSYLAANQPIFRF
jgi:hypothetical protein